MSRFDLDVQKWAQKEFGEISEEKLRRIHNILISSGWKAEKYKPSMKSQLENWLKSWYTLSVKKLPSVPTK